MHQMMPGSIVKKNTVVKIFIVISSKEHLVRQPELEHHLDEQC